MFRVPGEFYVSIFLILEKFDGLEHYLPGFFVGVFTAVLLGVEKHGFTS